MGLSVLLADLAERGDPVKVTRELVDAAGF